MFNKKILEDHLSTSWLGRNFIYFDELDSTNKYAKSLKSEAPLHGTLILADNQVKGIGQYQRTWEVSSGLNLTFSLIFQPETQHAFNVLTIACALAVANICTKETGKKFRIKWPNDVICNGKKIAGILTEGIYSGNDFERLVIGIGLNVNERQFNGELQETASSLCLLAGKTFSREMLLTALLAEIEKNYQAWYAKNVDLIKTANKNMIGFGDWVTLIIDGKEQPEKQKFLGVDENGALIALNKELELNTFFYEQIRIKAD